MFFYGKHEAHLFLTYFFNRSFDMGVRISGILIHVVCSHFLKQRYQNYMTMCMVVCQNGLLGIDLSW